MCIAVWLALCCGCVSRGFVWLHARVHTVTFALTPPHTHTLRPPGGGFRRDEDVTPSLVRTETLGGSRKPVIRLLASFSAARLSPALVRVRVNEDEIS